MRTDLAGKIRNTQLKQSRPLQPLFEAVVNSFDAIYEAATRTWTTRPRITITVLRDQHFQDVIYGDINGFVIEDNGIGFTDSNLRSFFTAESSYKADRGGKGNGRFSWLKAFDLAEIESHYLADGSMRCRRFTFDVTMSDDDAPSEPSERSEPLTVVRLIGFREPYKSECPKKLESVGERLIEHCLPYFLVANRPEISIREQEGESLDLNSQYADTFEAKATAHQFTVGEHRFVLRGFRLHHPVDSRHKLAYAANQRVVLTEHLQKFLPNLQKALTSNGTAFYYLGFLEGAYLDQNTNPERTEFSLPPGDEVDTSQVNMSHIREGGLDCIRRDLAEFFEAINAEKQTRLRRYVEQEPQYKAMIRYVPEFIDQIPPAVTERDLDLILHEKRSEKERQIKSESETLLDANKTQALKPEDYKAKINDFLERANELGKSSLAEYVAHRKVILDFLASSLQSDESGKYKVEDAIHRIIYPMRTTSEDVPYEQQNLWIIDERLSYHWYLSSDMPLREMPMLGEGHSLDRPDLLIFDRALSFAEDDAPPLTSLVIVEFKRPQRSDFGKEDPVEQVLRLIREIKEGHFTDKNGREIKVQSQQIPAYGYVICDITEPLEKNLLGRGFTRSPDNMGWFDYNPNYCAYLEVISYSKLLSDARKRNKVLFDKLRLA
jgi:hypothetical protein